MSKTRQLAAVMFADIVGYTALMQENEPDALLKLQKFKHEISAQVELFDGEIKNFYGDGCLVMFSNVVDAIAAARQLQLMLKNEPVVPVRIGIHLGDVIFEADNIFGDCVNIASRIESMGIPGSVLISDSVHKQVKNQPEYTFISLGQYEFKNVQEPIEVYALTGPSFPVPERSLLLGKFKEHPSLAPSEPPTRKKSIPLNKYLWISGLAIILIFAAYFINDQFTHQKLISPKQQVSQELPRSIAVLPFADLSPEGNQEYLGDGLADDIIRALSGVEGLKVIGRTSSFQFKGKTVDLRDIGEILQVGSVLEGSVQKAGNQIRVIAQLINVADGSHIWSERWDREMTDIFIVQDEISNGIKQKLQVTIQPGMTNNPMMINPASFEDYLKGRQLYLTGLPENVKQAKKYFLQAIDLDPNFADAMAFLSLTYYTLAATIYPGTSASSPGDLKVRRFTIDSAELYAHRALALDPRNSSAHLAMAGVNNYNYNWIEAEKEYRKAHELNPGSLEKSYLALFLSIMGFFEEGKQLAQQVILQDPLDVNALMTLTNILLLDEKYDEAIITAHKALKIDSLHMRTWAALGHAYVLKDLRQEGLMTWAKQHEIYGLHNLSNVYRTSDFKSAMLAWIKQATTSNSPVFADDFTIAVIYAYFKDADNTIKYLNLAYQHHAHNIARIKTWPSFAFIRHDQRYARLYQQLGLDTYDQYKK